LSVPTASLDDQTGLVHVDPLDPLPLDPPDEDPIDSMVYWHPDKTSAQMSATAGTTSRACFLFLSCVGSCMSNPH
jgi:hypothetical protein